MRGRTVPARGACLTSPTGAVAEPSARGLVEALRTAFVNERCAPELLPHQDGLVFEIKELINEQAASPRCGPFALPPL